jgi:hypothetical protein
MAEEFPTIFLRILPLHIVTIGVGLAGLLLVACFAQCGVEGTIVEIGSAAPYLIMSHCRIAEPWFRDNIDLCQTIAVCDMACGISLLAAKRKSSLCVVVYTSRNVDVATAKVSLEG